MTTQTFNGTPIFFTEQGSGEPIVLVHGSWAEQDNWDLVAGALARTHRVVRYDRRGHGQSTADPVEGTVHDDVADLAALIRDLGLAPADIIGNSYGSSISLRLAAEHPGLVRRVAVHEPPLFGLLAADPATQPLLAVLQERMTPVIELLEKGDEASAAEQFVENVALGPGTWAALPAPLSQESFIRNAGTFLGESRDPDALSIDPAALAGISCPVLLTEGDQSPPLFSVVAGKVRGAVPDLTHHVFVGAGHIPHVTHPEDFVTTVAGFLG